jgi:hypothetical protein
MYDLPPGGQMKDAVCSSDDLGKKAETGLLPNVLNAHKNIVSAHKAVVAAAVWPKQVALILVCVGLMPWAWYFLLRRIAELRGAITGKPPI